MRFFNKKRGKKSNKDDEQAAFRDLLDTVRWSLDLQFKISKWKAILYLVIRSLDELKPLVYSYIFAKILDRIIALAGQNGSSIYDLTPYFVALFAYSLFDIFSSEIKNYTRNSLRNWSWPYLRRMLYLRIQDLGIQSLEEPGISNKLSRAEESVSHIIWYVETVITIIARAVRGIAAFLIILQVTPIGAMIVIPATVFMYIVEKKYLKEDWSIYRSETENRRKAWYSSSDLTDNKSLTEVIITGSNGFLDKKFISYWKSYNTKLDKLYQKWHTTGLFTGGLKEVAILVGFALILQKLIQGEITVGDATFYYQSLNSLALALMTISYQLGELYQSTIKLKDSKDIFEMEPPFKDGTFGLPLLEAPPLIEFKNVSFKYPDTDRYVIKNLNLTIQPGEEIAIVGHNGAGKTTLVKLLSRFYQVSEGEILVNGTNINDLKIEDWYKNIGVLFQEYNKYSQLTLEENIAMGRGGKKNRKLIRQAAESADIIGLLKDFKKGWKQILGENFKGGIRPSTGQWQKIAIARFFYRDSPVVIFDEPTAAIDAEAEYKIFNRIYKFMENKTVVVISHRFSTVRNADRIIVFDKGKIVENGTHEELLQKDGKYAKAFKLQAEGYK